MSLNIDKLKKGIFGVSKATSPFDAYEKWYSFLVDYFKDDNVNGFVPNTFPKTLPTSFDTAAKAKTFVDDFDKILAEWVKSCSWSNGKDVKKSQVSDAIGFKAFSDANQKQTNVNKFVNDLATLLHNWFLKITV